MSTRHVPSLLYAATRDGCLSMTTSGMPAVKHNQDNDFFSHVPICNIAGHHLAYVTDCPAIRT